MNQIKMKRNNNRGREGETNIENNTQLLPQDLVTEILLRLLVKSLIHFKCVFKSWLSLISDLHFATLHFDLTTAAHTNRLVLISNRAYGTRSIDFEAPLNDDAAIASLKLDFLLPQSNLTLQIGGSSRGFLFLYSDENIYLWNPSTGVHKQIPWSPILSNVDTTFYTYLYGFGYDPSTDDYLVVLGSNDPTPTDVVTHFEFFSLRANIWKEIEGAPLPYFDACINPKVGTLFNVAIHWLTHHDDIPKIVIVSYDLTERRISEIAILDGFEYYDASFCDLWVFRGFMSLWAMKDDTIEIWVMKEHGVSLSWTKTFVLSIDETQYFSPICSTNYGDIVGLEDGSSALVKYNDNGQLLEHRSYCNRPYGSLVAFYTESLLPLSLPRDTQQA